MPSARGIVVTFACSIFVSLGWAAGSAEDQPPSATVKVASIADVALAGAPDGTRVQGDVSPLNSPVQIPLEITGGQVLQFAAEGSVQFGTYRASADGVAERGTFTSGAFGLSSVGGPGGALVGVFLGAGTPDTKSEPPGLEFSGAARELRTIRPLLQQPFYIGGGVTPGGLIRNVVVPDGAARLFLAVLFCCGSNAGTEGSFSATVRRVAGPPPEIYPNLYGIADIALAGSKPGSVIQRDTSPLNSPVELPGGVSAGQVLKFRITGWDMESRAPVSAEGDTTRSTFTSDSGISSISGPPGAVIGVFLGAEPPDPRHVPAGLNFSGSSRDLIQQRPALQQAFFVGSGFTRSGSQREIVVPAGSSRLFFGVLYCCGSNWPTKTTFFIAMGAAATPISCLPNKNTCTPIQSIVQELGSGRFHIILPANQKWGASIANPKGTAVTVTNAAGRVCWDPTLPDSTQCNGPRGSSIVPSRDIWYNPQEFLEPSTPAGALISTTENGRTSFSVNDRDNIYLNTATFDDNEGYFEFDVVTPISTRARTVFLLHGIAQGREDMAPFAARLVETLSAASSHAYTVDADFDYSHCTRPSVAVLCSDDCTIANGARHLASYIVDRKPVGDIVLIGYSLGGLIARELIAHNYQNVFHGPRPPILITLGTPHLGYPYTFEDGLARCRTLVREMFGDFRNSKTRSLPCIDEPDSVPCEDLVDRNGNIVTLSKSLYDLHMRWESEDAPYRPTHWLAISGSFCPDGTRGAFNRDISGANTALGCSDSNPQNDGVVCDQSARFLWLSKYGPTERYVDPTHSHTKSWWTWKIFCRSNREDLAPLDNPSSIVVDKVREFLNTVP